MIVGGYSQDRFRRRLSGFGGAWEDWCDQKFPSDPTNLTKCKAWGPFPPYTDVGAIMRGIPKPSSLVVSILQPSAPVPYDEPPAPKPPPVKTDILGIPKTVFMVGGGLLVAGLVLTRRKK